MTWACLHPFITYSDDSHIIEKFQMSLTTETKNGVPHGLCFVEFNQDKDNTGEFDLSFFGFCVMYEGEMHSGPAIFVQKDGIIFRFNMMINGRSDGDGIIYQKDDLNYYELRNSLPLMPDSPNELATAFCFGDLKKGLKAARFIGKLLMISSKSQLKKE